MLKFSANLVFLFTELPFMERFAAARKAGFDYVEFMFPYDYDQNEIAAELEQHQLQLTLFNLPAGNWEKGDRGIAADPSRREEFRTGVQQAIAAAKRFGVTKVNCLVGKHDGEIDASLIRDTLVENLSYAADELGKHSIDLMIESINNYDIPGFYLNTTSKVLDVMAVMSRSNVYLQYDVYHAEREGEDHQAILHNHFAKIGHIQVADNPGRNQPGTGVIDYPFIFDELKRLGYEGYIGMEYKPHPNTEASLQWVHSYKL